MSMKPESFRKLVNHYAQYLCLVAEARELSGAGASN